MDYKNVRTAEDFLELGIKPKLPNHVVAQTIATVYRQLEREESARVDYTAKRKVADEKSAALKDLEGKVRKDNAAWKEASADREKAVSELNTAYDSAMHEVYQRIFPNIAVSNETAQNLARALIAGRDILIYGPPGSGKTSVLTELEKIMPSQIYVVETCRVQCNPYSLLDETFAEKAIPCPECTDKYLRNPDGTINKVAKEPKKIPVKLLQIEEGYGLAAMQGSGDVMPSEVVGGLNLIMLQTGHSADEPEVFQPGKLLMANNGRLYVTEIGKFPDGVQKRLLVPISENRTMVTQQRKTWPTTAIWLCDTNTADLARMTDALVDRLMFIPYFYPKDVEEADLVLRREMKKVDGHNYLQIDHCKLATQDFSLADEIGLPVTRRKAIAHLFTQWREGNADKDSVVNSNRTQIESMWLSYANAYMADRRVAISKDIREGVVHAMLGQTVVTGKTDYLATKDRYGKFVDENIEKILAQEGQVLWCNFQKYMKDRLNLVEAAALEKAEQEAMQMYRTSEDALKVIENQNAVPTVSTLLLDFAKQTHEVLPSDNASLAELLVALQEDMMTGKNSGKEDILRISSR